MSPACLSAHEREGEGGHIAAVSTCQAASIPGGMSVQACPRQSAVQQHDHCPSNALPNPIQD